MLCIVSALGMRAQTWTGNPAAEGTFYLYNVEAGKFLNNGDPNQNWGTNAYLQAGFGMDIKLEAAGENVFNLNTNVSNGGTSNYLASSTWCDGAATPWTFRAVDGQTNVYQIINNGQYIMANEALNDVELLGDPGSRATSTYWKLVSEDDFKAAMQAKTYSATDPMDVSIFIKGRSFARNDGRNNTWVRTYQNANNQKWIEGGNGSAADAAGKYYGNEFWNQTFDIHQEITGLPDGTYEVKCSGFGTNGTTFVYGNTKEGALTSENAAANGSRFVAYKEIADNNAWAGQTTGTFTLSGGKLTVGLKRTENKNADWCVYDEFRLYYYGLDLSEFAATLAEAVAAAEAVEGTVPTAAYNVLANVVAEQNQTYTSAAEYTAATEAIVNATNTAKALQLNYTRYKNVKAAVLAINNGIETATADAQVEAATDNAGIDAAVATVRQALAEYLPTVTLAAGQTIDLTAALIDNAAPGISGSTDYWTNSETPTLQYQLFEFYQKSGATTKQTILTTLPAGNYKLSAIAYTRDNMTATLNAGENTVNLVGCGSVNDRNGGNTWIAGGNGVNNLVFNLAEATANLEIGLTADNATGDHWMCWRSFSLVYGDVFEPYTLAEGKMNKDVAAAQTQADATFKATPSPTTYMAVLNAIAAAEASIKAYAPMTAAVDKIDAALAAATSATESTDAYNTVKAAYTEATIADADIMAQVAAAYDAVIPVIKSQTAANADFTLAIQNHSFEYGNMTGWTAAASSDTGVRETSNATYAATGSDGSYLFNTWWQGVPLTQALEGLPTGEYTLTASVASDGATIYLLANGEHNEGTETAGEYPTKDTFQDATITFLVKDGKATIGVVGGADGEAGVHKDYVEAGYWWYKADNFRLVKNRELTEEEMAVIPTAIALDETEVTLTADAQTKTFELTFTPEDATNTVTWTSSDESVATVADGVVTAISSGTATITVTSTLDENVKAEATVTVSFPETEVASEDVVIDGPALSTVTYGPNLIKNGSFEYPNAYYGWTYGTGSTTPITSEKFDIVTEGAADGNQYLKAKTNEGGAAAGSLNTSWELEDGKTYVFGYKIKANAGATANTYIGTSLNNTKGQENANKKFDAPTYGTDWTDVKYKFTNDENFKYLVFNARWLGDNKSFDAFYLVEVTSESTVGNVEYATAAIPTANIGTGAFQYSQDAVDAANALVQGTATVAEVEAAYNALQVLNAPAEDQLYNIVVAEESNTKKGNALVIVPGATSANNPTGYGLNVNLAPNTNLNQAVTFTKVDGNNYNISFETAEGTTYLTTGSLNGSAAGWKTQQIQATADAEKKCAFTIVASKEENNVFYIYNPEHNEYVDYQDGGALYTDTNIDHKSFSLVETQKPSITINTTAAGWGTTMLPFAVTEIPEGVKVYSCAEANGATLTLSEVTALEANKPYIIEGAWEATLTGDAQGTQLQYTEGMLTGTYAKIAAQDGWYILQKQGEKVGFFKVDTSKAQPNVGANRAYLTAPAGSEIKAFDLGGDTDGINSLVNDLQKGDIYDLAGRKVQRMQKGNVYIVNGKKVVVK